RRPSVTGPRPDSSTCPTTPARPKPRIETVDLIGNADIKGESIMSFFSPARLARASARHPGRVLGAWIVILVLAVMSASSLGDALTTTSNFSGKPESATGEQLLKDRMRGEKPAPETISVRSENRTIDDPSFKAIVDKTSSDVLAIPGAIVSAPTYYQAVANSDTGAANMVSADSHLTILPV